MILPLKNRSGDPIEIKNIDRINDLISKLKEYTQKNPTKGEEAKIRLLLASETFSTLFTEGEVSSRKHIKKFFNNSNQTPENIDTKIQNFVAAYNYALKAKPFSISDIFSLYSLIASGVIDAEAKLADGEMYRSEPVYINSNQIAGDFEGFEPSDIKPALTDLCNYLNNDQSDSYLKAIVGYLYFEIIHPFYDFNGRTGRFIPMWLFANEGNAKEMMYFATAIGNFKEKYRSTFNRNINHKTYEIDFGKMIIDILTLLITNQHQYIWMKEAEKKYTNQVKKSFTSLQKDFIWSLMNKLENSSASTDSWFKFDEKAKDFVESNMRQATFSDDTNALKDAKIIDITNDKPRKYKLLNYELCPIR